jgi:NAD-dependent SIR2 family protein deacetylase
MTDVKIRELDWYLRDHLFRQSNTGRIRFEKKMVPAELVKLYLRFRNDNVDEISQLLDGVIDSLLHRNVIKMYDDHNSFELCGNLKRFQCSKCYYISYLTEAEDLACLRCNSTTLDEFPKKRK